MRYFRSMGFGLLAVLASAMLFQIARAGGHYYPPVTDALVKEECGSCHLAFPPSMLPSSSWQRLMAGLKNHFGDDASVDPATANRIR
ncbi:MAG TPA: cytochrome C, partial [Accumulibacter sp.]|nr:cytochrome C [Accumulibacter sp.]